MTTISTSDSPAYQWEIIDKVCILRARAGEFAEPEFNRWLREVRSSKVESILAVASGVATVTATQRKATADMIKEKGIKTYVVTDSALTRGIVTAVSWLGAQISSHSWKELDQVLAKLGTSSAITAQVRALVEAFRV